MKSKLIPVVFFLFFILEFSSAQTNLILSGENWKFLDTGTDLGTSWYSASYNDSNWSIGNSPLGYGLGQTTTVGYGGNASNKYITTYFRKSIQINNVFSQYSLKVKRDDGIVVYVNGVAVYTNNMPSTYTYQTTASTTASDNGGTWFTVTLSGSYFQQGNNTIAVEVHQVNPGSSDLFFDMELTALNYFVRWPYLQKGGANTMSILWTTNILTSTQVKWGTKLGVWSDSIKINTLDSTHKVILAGLLPDTKYYYAIGTSTTGSYTHYITDPGLFYFQTSPSIGDASRKLRIWALGDCGYFTATQKNVKSAFLSYMNGADADALILLGDNAYAVGSKNEYESNFFNVYKDILSRTKLFPATGNHDYAEDPVKQISRNMPYYDIFDLPKNAELGGVASNTEAYYSYDLGNIHFIVLDSYGVDYSNATGQYHRFYDTLNSPQISWLKQDLAATTQRWKVVYFHHPPYTKGTHDSDGESELLMIRSNLNKILEDAGVDLVVNGHSHNYERSYFLNGHYGYSFTFNPSQHAISSSSARYDASSNSCPYIRSNKGTLYVVAGSSSATGWGGMHPAMSYTNLTTPGSLVLEVDNNRLDGKFITPNGSSYSILDQFTIVKDVNKNTTVSTAPNTPLDLSASWPGTYLWANGQTSKTITYTTSSAQNLTVSDGLGCLQDSYQIQISEITSATISNQNCSGSNQSFSLLVSGYNLGSQYSITGFPNGYNGNTTGVYGNNVQFSGIPSAFFPLQLTIKDNFCLNCSYNVTVNAVSCASPNLQLSITQDNFVPNGASPYTTSTREITIQNTGSATAQNISLQLGLSPYYSYSAMQLANVQVLDASNVPIAGASVNGTTWTGSNDPTGFPCGGTSSNYKSTIQVSIPSLAIGAIAKVRVTADHCMANFEHTTTSYYTWNYWGAEAAYQDGIGMSYSTARLNNNAAQALDNYVWTAYQAPYTPPVVTSGSNLFTVELGSGTYGNPSNNQNRGSSYPYSRARVDLVLPGNVVFNTGSLSDIVGEYSVDGTANQLATVTASSIQWGPTLSNGDQTYYILFPPSQYLPIRRIFLSLRVMSYPVGVHDISARIRTTFDYHYATDTYGWLPASPNYSYRTQSGAFPVDLLSFTGGIFNENAELSWITGSESNNAGFEVEKSLNGNDFQKIGFVEGAGTTSSAQNYNFTDYNFSSRAWYRLNQVDYDGKATPSNIVELSSESLLATISPNPLENGIATISLPAGENRKITVYNALGGKVLETYVDTNIYTLNLSAQSEGVYSVVCLVDGKKQVLKVKR